MAPPAPPPYGVYVHFPWCSFRCPYCDFAVAVEAEVPEARYAAALRAELEARRPPFAGLAARSLYLGGGTPSLFAPERIAEVIAAVRDRCQLPAGAEVTLEANPESCHPARLAAFREAGVNRLSLGVQSFDAAVLAKLGRRHRPEDATRAVQAARGAFENVSVDVIYGARRSTVATAREDGARLAALGVPHVSAYALTVEAEALGEETPLARLRRAGRLPLPPDEEVVAQARALRGALRRGGLRRYEISNFARPGFESVHNRLYWSSDAYLGIGVGAYGCAPLPGGAAVRWGNARTPAAWFEAVEAGRLPTAEEDRLGPPERAEERVLLALRTREGLPEDEVAAGRRGEVDALLRARLAVRRGGNIVLTSRGMDVHSAVVERLI
ncbi:MAG TPA: radical SAM family heme chaperone HemW [Anaeromyxobacteraceae bacterium]|nr:radical SAM family heme chaperone HemW [Anaeromyxobacteraceae bacterium]